MLSIFVFGEYLYLGTRVGSFLLGIKYSNTSFMDILKTSKFPGVFLGLTIVKK